MPIKKHILFFLFLIAGVIFRVEAQPPSSWDYTPTDVFHEVLVPNGVCKMNLTLIQPGDAIGAFLNEKCYGYIIYPDTLLRVYGRDSMAIDGFTNGDTIEFKIWQKNLQCSNNLMELSFSSGTNLFQNFGYSVIDRLWGSYGNVIYSTTTFCDNQPSEAPSITVKQVTFDALDQPIVIDSLGVIDPVNSDPGSYTILFLSETCLINKQVNVKIGKAPKISTSESLLNVCDSVSLSVTDADSIRWSTGETTNSVLVDQTKIVSVFAKGMYNCELNDTILVNVSSLDIDSLKYTVTDDQIWIDTGSVDNGSLPYKYYLNNGLTTIENLYGEFKDLENGEYTIQVKDNFGCFKSYNNTITVKVLDLKDLYIDITHADCYNESKIEIDESTIVNGSFPYTYKLISNTDTLTYYTPLINDVPVGLYTLMVTDNRGISRFYADDIEVKRIACEKGILIFSATSDDPGFFVPYIGKVRVYNRNGMLIKEFLAPAKWDGTDTRGELVPMGDYVIVHENEEPLKVTVIR